MNRIQWTFQKVKAREARLEAKVKKARVNGNLTK
jgi:hypothetical protein